jgi:hypothetical protein
LCRYTQRPIEGRNFPASPWTAFIGPPGPNPAQPSSGRKTPRFLNWPQENLRISGPDGGPFRRSARTLQKLPCFAIDTRADPDAELLSLGKDFERLYALEKPLHAKLERLDDRSDRLRYVRMGVDPDDKGACDRVAQNRYKEWLEKKTETNKETGRDTAYDEWHEATKRTARLGRKILRVPAATMDGLLRARVIEVEQNILDDEPEKLLLKEIRRFAKQTAA